MKYVKFYTENYSNTDGKKLRNTYHGASKPNSWKTFNQVQSWLNSGNVIVYNGQEFHKTKPTITELLNAIRDNIK